MRRLLLALSLTLGSAPARAQLAPVERRDFLRSVRVYIKAHQENGVFELHDDVLDREWFLKLIHLYRERVAARADGLTFTCADFQQADGAHKVDVDFYARKKAGAWVVEKTAIHRVDGQARFLYNERNEPVE